MILTCNYTVYVMTVSLEEYKVEEYAVYLIQTLDNTVIILIQR